MGRCGGSDKVCSGSPTLIRTCVAEITQGWADKRRRAMGTSGLKNGRDMNNSRIKR